MSNHAVPKELEASYQFLKQAFSQGLSETDYWAVLKLFYSHFSDRQLALLVATFTQKDRAQVTNDIYQTFQLVIDTQIVEGHLKLFGYNEIIASGD